MTLSQQVKVRLTDNELREYLHSCLRSPKAYQLTDMEYLEFMGKLRLELWGTPRDVLFEKYAEHLTSVRYDPRLPNEASAA